MALTPEEVKQAYQSILNREPVETEIEHVISNHDTLSSLRASFLLSEEFGRQYEAMQKQNRASLKPTLIHIHIPKTAGTTLAQALEKESALQPALVTNDLEIEALLKTPRRERRALRYVRGHLSMGFGERLDIPHRYMTVLRKPGRRIFSFYQFIMRTHTHPLHEHLTHHKLDFGGFLDYCLKQPAIRLEVDNGQVRRLAGLLGRPTFGQETELLRDALHNVLSPNMIVGFAEKFDLLVERLVSEGYLTQTELERFNSSPNSSEFEAACAALSEEQTALFENFTMWDEYLYDVCETLLTV